VITTSAAFQAAAVKNQGLQTYIQVYSSGGVLLTTQKVISAVNAGGKSSNSNAGSITLDNSSAQRRTCQINLPGVDSSLLFSRTPSTSDKFNPFGNQMWVYTGYTTSEAILLGIFDITSATYNDFGAYKGWQINGKDFSYLISKRAFKQPYTIAAGTNVASAVYAIINSIRPGLGYNLATTTATTPNLAYKEGDDPWAAATQLAQAAGFQLYFDHLGVCQMQPIVISGASVWTFADNESSIIYSLQRTVSSEKIYNDVVVMNEGTGNTTPVAAAATDSSSSSPSYIGGAYGDVPEYVRDTNILTTAQAQAAANNYLNMSLGQVETIALATMPFPPLEPYDIVTVTRAGSNVNAQYIIDSLSIPLGAASNQQQRMSMRRVIGS
jgi:hypothetical protein